MTATVTIVGADAFQRRMRDWPEQLDRAAALQVTDEIRPLMASMRDRAFAYGGSARPAARTLRIATNPQGLSIVAGGGSSVGTIVLAGAEYGGRKRPKRGYATRSRTGTAYLVRRRTTQQFRPHLGSRGYWFWPTARTDLRGINERVGVAIRKAVA